MDLPTEPRIIAALAIIAALVVGLAAWLSVAIPRRRQDKRRRRGIKTPPPGRRTSF